MTDSLCEQFSSCSFSYKPKLYNMLLSDLNQLAHQYISNITEYSFDLQPEFDYTDITDINELLQYVQNNNTESLLISIILHLSPSCHIYLNTISSIIDYYIECLSSAS